MFKTAYETTACKGLKTDGIISQVKMIIALKEGIMPIIGEKTDEMNSLKAVLPTPAPIAPFSHPIWIEPTGSYEGYGIVDVRPYVSLHQGKVAVKNYMEMGVAISRGLLQNLWVDQGSAPFAATSAFPTKIFSTWVSETLSRNLGLDLGSQLQVRAIAAHHFVCMFDETPYDETNSTDIAKLTMKMTRYSGVDGYLLTDLMSKLIPTQNLKDFCTNLALHGGSMRLEDISPEVLISILARSWFGVNAASIVGVALEYPPTWYAMLYAALKQQGLKRTNIAQLALMHAKDETAKSFGLFVNQYGTGGLQHA